MYTSSSNSNFFTKLAPLILERHFQKDIIEYLIKKFLHLNDIAALCLCSTYFYNRLINLYIEENIMKHCELIRKHLSANIFTSSHEIKTLSLQVSPDFFQCKNAYDKIIAQLLNVRKEILHSRSSLDFKTGSYYYAYASQYYQGYFSIKNEINAKIEYIKEAINKVIQLQARLLPSSNPNSVFFSNSKI